MPQPSTEDARPKQIGLITADPSPTLISVITQAGLDFLVLDAEQTGLTVRDCTDVVQRVACSGIEVAIRVPDLAGNTLVAFANTGASELVLPQVRSVSELEHAHRVTRYLPDGNRSAQASFSSGFGKDFSHAPRITVLFETLEATESVADIAASEHFQGGWVGPADLASDLRLAGRSAPNALELATKKIVDGVCSQGGSLGLPASGIGGIAAAFDAGADRVALYWERHLTAVISELVDAPRGSFDSRVIANDRRHKR
ncbi:aldolase/citrate lyase family protein [Salinibacterium sp. TMP30]|uniref:aldolase/citrate lyase family protein n=1 Tax=Salinibacterium sp. TMP30 TaxID=3138237 RepID=UPI003138B18B